MWSRIELLRKFFVTRQVLFFFLRSKLEIDYLKRLLYECDSVVCRNKRCFFVFLFLSVNIIQTVWFSLIKRHFTFRLGTIRHDLIFTFIILLRLIFELFLQYIELFFGLFITSSTFPISKVVNFCSFRFDFCTCFTHCIIKIAFLAINLSYVCNDFQFSHTRVFWFSCYAVLLPSWPNLKSISWSNMICDCSPIFSMKLNTFDES